MPSHDRSYFLRRAETEEHLAARAGNPCAAHVHRTLARLYRMRSLAALPVPPPVRELVQ